MNCPKCGSELIKNPFGYYFCVNELLTFSKEESAEMAFNEMKARAEKAEGELLELKERLGVGDCDYCHEQKENEIKEIREEAEALSEKLVKENQELGIKLAKAKGELKAIKARIEAVTEAEAFKIVDLVVKNCVRDNTVMSYREHISKAVVNLIKQIGGEKE